MLHGLMLLRRRGGTLALGRLLWKQGVIWFLLATLVQIPPTVFICLDLNDPLDLMFQSPCLITMSIAATRMHRTLVDFLSSNIAHESPPNDGRTFPKAAGTPVVLRTPFTHIEVAVHTAYEEYPTTPLTYCGSYTGIGMEEALYGEPRVLSLENDLESG